jgi:hypothetical protein
MKKKKNGKFMKHLKCRSGLLFALVAGVSLAAGSINGLSGALKMATVPGVPMPDPNWAKSVSTAPYKAPPLANGLRQPGVPAIIRVSKDKIKLVIDPNGNTFATLFAVQETKSGKFVQKDGRLGASAVYQSFAQWGDDNGIVIPLPLGTAYAFKVYAKAGIDLTK